MEEDKPTQATPEELAALEAENRPATNKGIAQYKHLLIPLVIALVVSWGMQSFVGVPRSDFNANINAMTASIGAQKTQLTAQITALNTQITTLRAELEDVGEDVAVQVSFVSDIENLSAKIDNINNSLASINSHLNTLDNSASLNTSESVSYTHLTLPTTPYV